MSAAVEVHGIAKAFGKVQALDAVSFAVARGSVLALLGPNGAGKTTTVRILATLTRPDAGTARIGGFDVVRDARQVRRRIGLTGQFASVDEDLSGTQNLRLIGELVNLRRSAARQRAAELLEWFGLTDAARRLVKTYSGGMRRRLDLAASLVARPEVVFLDEPTTGLDPLARTAVWRAVRALAAAGSTVLLTTQYLDEADALSDGIVVVDRGQVIAAGTAIELKRRVGGQRLTVRPVDPRRAEDATLTLRQWAGGPVTRPRDGVLCAPVPNDAAAAAALAALVEDGIQIAEMSLALPTLDEAFEALTAAPDTQAVRP